MEDLSQKIESLLSDPESMQNLAELAAMLRSPEDTPETAAETDGAAAPADADAPPPFDAAKLLGAAQAFAQAQQDGSAALILALKPHLTPARAARADRAARMLRMYHAAEILRENGVLADFLGGTL